MDKYIDSRFERLEKALSTLIDSVTKYHPSVSQAEELKAADEDLSRGLEQGELSRGSSPARGASRADTHGKVQAHQNNYLRIQQLRQTSAALDTQIKDILTSLAAARRGIVTTRTTTFPREPNYPIAYEELLSYARRISKTTLPPAATINAAAAATAAAAGTVPTSPEGQTPAAESQPQSAVTPSARTPSRTQSPAPNGIHSQAPLSEPPTQQTAALSMNTSLPEHMSQYLNPLSGQLFFPWPAEDKIRSGALASYQMLVEEGIDPKGYDPVTEEERKRKDEEARKAKEEQEQKEREEREKQIRDERERLRAERERQREKEQEEWRRASIAGQPSDVPGLPRTNTGAGEKKQFQFTNLDDLDDDDDDDD
ncbi:mediator of RNA polymerase II transcription subunit 4 [Purpureocillium lavendulum]|uniref:Mediator of RNA polymerase II transcription subunit 4 n=1 Tax=Purpureocillium lavendulum TaxID=1247861 RepID=A0AB34G849_9HYPO|nr:mediator of RNA polymerase II transcription subunit 4 [Purpureocillium lavendulum]